MSSEFDFDALSHDALKMLAAASVDAVRKLEAENADLRAKHAQVCCDPACHGNTDAKGSS